MNLASMSILLSLVLLPVPARAYEADVHFSLTYALCRETGFTATDALSIASADESMDLSASTRAWPVASLDFRKKNRDWHAFGRSREAVLKRRDELWTRAFSANDPIKLGQFLHFEQDMFSHRKRFGTDWQPFGDTFGHLFEGTAPDRIPYHLDIAKEMARETTSYLEMFLKHRMSDGQLKGDDARTDSLIDKIAATYRRIDTRGGDVKRAMVKPQWSLGAADQNAVALALHSPPLSSVIVYKFSQDGSLRADSAGTSTRSQPSSSDIVISVPLIDSSTH